MKFSPNSSCASIPGHTPAGAHEIIPSARSGLRFLLQAGLQPAQQMIRAVGTRGTCSGDSGNVENPCLAKMEPEWEMAFAATW